VPLITKNFLVEQVEKENQGGDLLTHVHVKNSH